MICRRQTQREEVLDLVTARRMEREILILASDVQLRIAMEQALFRQGYRRLNALSVSEASTQAVGEIPHLCVLCVSSNGCHSAMNVVRQFRQQSPEVKFIIISDSVCQTTELSTSDFRNLQFLSQPFLMLDFIAMVEHAL